MAFTGLPNDPLFQFAWHLKNTGQGGGTPGMDINVTSVWQYYTGSGVRVAVLDDGVEATHPDLAANMVTASGGLQSAPVRPGSTNESDNHGTPVAGVIAEVANNGIGSVGVSPDAKVLSYRILGGDNDGFATPSQSFGTFIANNVDVSNNSWGKDEAFNSTWAESGAAITAFGTDGRAGKGGIIVFANGNARDKGTDGNLDMAVNNRFVIAVGATDSDGKIMSYSTKGANLLVVAPGGYTDSDISQKSGIVTTDRAGTTNGYNTTTFGGDYAGFNGTSAAAPIVSGVAALMLSANGNLGYRDVQEILALTARQVDVGNATWLTTKNGHVNGGGLNFSTDYGFGMVNAAGAVRLSEAWSLTRNEANAVVANGTVGDAAQAAANSVTRSFTVAQPTGAHTGFRLNHVDLNLGLTVADASKLTVMLVSPDGTSIKMMADAGNAKNTAWPTGGFTLGTDAYWGEKGVGTWTVTISTTEASLAASAFNSAALTLYGDGSTGKNLLLTDFLTDDFGRLAGLTPSRLTLGSGGVTELNAAPRDNAIVVDLAAKGAAIDGRQAFFATDAAIRDVVGGGGDDQLFGDAAANTLTGSWGNDTLDGRGGNDILRGGKGHDNYVVDSSGDVVTELADEGMDTVYSTAATFALGANIEIGRLIGTGEAFTTTSTAGVQLVGNATRASVLTGGTGADTLWNAFAGGQLNGGDGDDVLRDQGFGAVMSGGAGNDAYVVTTVASSIKAESAGIDTAWIGATDGVFAAATGLTFIRLFGGASAVTGSASDEQIVANATMASTLNGGGGKDTLWGSAFADTLNGGDGDDTIYGGGGNDTMRGGLGDDQFVVSGAGATVIEAAGEGTDTLWLDLAASTDYTVLDNIEFVRLIGATNRATGSATDNVMVAGGSAATLNGMGGNDTLWGSSGADKLTGGAGNDVIYTGGGADTLFFANGWGIDNVAGFDKAAGAKLDFTAIAGLTYAGLNVVSAGGNTQVEYQGNIVLLHGTAALAQSDFIFG